MGWSVADFNIRAGAMTEIGHKALSGRVIEAAIEVHRTLGPGFLEAIYEEALCVELRLRSISYERQKSVDVLYRDVKVGEHRFDLVVEQVLLVELKTVKTVVDVFFAIGRSYLRALGLRDGLILNFAAMPLEIHRIGPGRAAPAS